MTVKREQSLITNFLTCMSVFYTITSGLFSTHYNFTQRRLIRPCWLMPYTILHNLFTACLVLFFLNVAFKYNILYETHPVARIALGISAVIYAIVTMLTLLLKRQRERNFTIIFRLLASSQQRFFKSFNTRQASKGLERLIYGQVISMFIYMLLTVCFTFLLTGSTRSGWATFVFTVLMLNILNGAAYHYVVVIWTTCGRFEILNQCLQQTLEKATLITYNDKLLQEYIRDLQEIAFAHKTLCATIQKLTETYQWQIFGIMLSYAVDNIHMGYLVVLFFRKFNNAGLVYFIFYMVTFVSQLVACFVFVLLCERLVKAANETVHTLGRTVEWPSIWNTEIMRASNVFAIQLSVEKFRINLFGFVDINRRLIFCIMSEIILYQIYLVQADYKNI